MIVVFIVARDVRALVNDVYASASSRAMTLPAPTMSKLRPLTQYLVQRKVSMGKQMARRADVFRKRPVLA